MGVYIPNMEKPKSCGECEFNYYLEGGSYEWWECVILHDDITQFDTRRTDCPLIEIITCRECKWWNKGFCNNGRADANLKLDKNCFCDEGERRTDE